MGILIIFGIILLVFGIYYKINNLNFDNSKADIINIKKIDGYKVKDFYIETEKIIVKYESNNKFIIHVYDLLSGDTLKRIELLK